MLGEWLDIFAYSKRRCLINALRVPKGENMLQIPLRAVVERNLHLSGNLMGGHEETFEVIELIRMGVIRPFVKKLCLEDVPSHLQDLVDCRGVGKYVVQV